MNLTSTMQLQNMHTSFRLCDPAANISITSITAQEYAHHLHCSRSWRRRLTVGTAGQPGP